MLHNTVEEAAKKEGEITNSKTPLRGRAALSRNPPDGC